MTAIRIHEPTPSEAAEAERVEAAAFASLRSIYVPTRQSRPAAGQTPAPLARLVATRNGILLGTLRWQVDEDRLHLRSLAVIPESRRSGIARALIEHCADMASQRQLRALSAYTVIETGNGPVFHRLGFVVVRQQTADFATTPIGGPVIEAYLERPIVRPRSDRNGLRS